MIPTYTSSALRDELDSGRLPRRGQPPIGYPLRVLSYHTSVSPAIGRTGAVGLPLRLPRTHSHKGFATANTVPRRAGGSRTATACDRTSPNFGLLPSITGTATRFALGDARLTATEFRRC